MERMRIREDFVRSEGESFTLPRRSIQFF
jgi:hypothetical protein